MNPSDFCMMQFDSVFQDRNTEDAATNIMTYLAHTGNTWRSLTWEEYKEGAMKDGHEDVWNEGHLFPKVQPYTESEEMARTFSKTWAKVPKSK